MSVTHGQCDARPTVTFPVTGHRCPATGTKLYCLVTEAHVCEQLVEGRYLTAKRPGVELATSRVASQRLNHYTTRPQCRYRHLFVPKKALAIHPRLFIVALCNRADHIYFHAVVYSSSSFFPRHISAAADWMSAILPHMVWP